MRKYIGTKIIEAEPATKGEYWGTVKLPEDARKGEAGESGYLVIYPDGYVSWYPQDVFEVAYHSLSDLTFGEAVTSMKQGYKATRSGWNGRGLFVVYQKGYPDGIPCNKQTAEAWGMKEGDLFRCEPYFQINTTDGSHAMWVPSVRDCLAEDWQIVE